MKKIVFIFCFVFAFISCNVEKKMMEEVIISELKVPSSYNFLEFSLDKTITLKDEVEERLNHFNGVLDIFEISYKSDSSSVAYYKRMNRNYGGYEDSIRIYEKSMKENKERVDETTKIINYLNGIATEYAEIYNKPSFKEYKLTYEAENSFGALLKGESIGRFNNDGVLVAIKVEEDSDWEVLDKFFSIPKYYDNI